MTYEELLNRYDEIVVIDAEYSAGSGQRPNPVCCCAWELKSGKQHRVWTIKRQTRSSHPGQTGRTFSMLFFMLQQNADFI